MRGKPDVPSESPNPDTPELFHYTSGYLVLFQSQFACFPSVQMEKIVVNKLCLLYLFLKKKFFRPNVSASTVVSP